MSKIQQRLIGKESILAPGRVCQSYNYNNTLLIMQAVFVCVCVCFCVCVCVCTCVCVCVCVCVRVCVCVCVCVCACMCACVSPEIHWSRSCYPCWSWQNGKESILSGTYMYIVYIRFNNIVICMSTSAPSA